MTWLDKQIKKLEETKSKFSEEIKIIKSVEPDTCNEFEEATPLKLIFLNYALDMYTTIIKKYSDNLFYVDLFAGSGLNRMRTSKDNLIGSPFIATLNHGKKYNKFFFCEQDKNLFNALRKRIESLSIGNSKIICGDCNKRLSSIITEIEKINNKHIFFFIDPYSMQFKWSSMKKVLDTYSDIVFTFMTHHIGRAWSSASAQPNYSTNALDEFFGDKSWKSARTVVDLIKIYKKNVLKVRENAIIESVHIVDYYDLIFITNKTSGKNPWMKCIKDAKKEIEKNSKFAVKTALNKCSRGQRDLTDY